jgi:hypothetical protein
MTRFDGANLIKRRLRDAGIVGDYSPHSSGRITFSGFVDDVRRFSWRQDFEDDVCWVAVERASS